VTARTAEPGEWDRYASGDYSFWSRVFEPASGMLVEAAGVSASHRMLDVAAGNGNTALAAARRGAIVTALDISRRQIERGRLRADAERRPVSWVEGDARQLPFADGLFDRVLNSFGDVIGVEEMLRVARPAGVIAIAEFTGDGFDGDLDELLYTPTPGVESTRTGPSWGREDHVRTVLEPQADIVEVKHVVTPARFESVDRFCGEFLRKDPDLLHTRPSAGLLRRFSAGLRRVATARNRARDGGLILDLVWLLTIATKRGSGL